MARRVSDIDVFVLVPHLGAVTKFGGQTAQFAVAPRVHFAPDGHPKYGVRATFALVFPKWRNDRLLCHRVRQVPHPFILEPQQPD